LANKTFGQGGKWEREVGPRRLLKAKTGSF